MGLTEKTELIYLDGKKVKALLSQRDLKQGDIASILGIHKTEVSKMITQARPALPRAIDGLCILLRVKPEEITCNKANPRPLCSHVDGVKWNNEYFVGMLAKKQITIVNLCSQIKKDTSIFYNYRKNKANPSVETIYDICNVLGCDAAKLTGVSIKKLNKVNKNIHFDLPTEDTCVALEEESSGSAVVEDEVNTQGDKYKRFTDQNVIVNMGILNDNLLAMVADFGKANEYLIKQVSRLGDTICEMQKKIDGLELTNTNPIVIDNTPVKKKAFGEGITCTSNEMAAICNSSIAGISLCEYKDKVFKLIKYISVKKGFVFTQAMHNAYVELKKIYGFDTDVLRQETNASSSIEAVYNNEICREIFFNLVCTNASKLQ